MGLHADEPVKTPLSNDALLSFDSMEGVYESPVVRKGTLTPPAPRRPVLERLLIPLVAAAAYALSGRLSAIGT